MNYYNKDGTGNALCGNGLRCTAQFIKDNSLAPADKLTLEAVDNLYNCTFNPDGTIKVFFPPPNYINPGISLKVHFATWWENLNCAYVNVGSPHIVVFIEDIHKPKVNSLEEVEVEKWGRNLRMHRELMPEGANINFVHVKQNQIEIRSYERGVEGETLACGTGAVASAIISFINKGLNPHIKVLTRSGDYLVVDFEEKNGEFINLSLSGPAVRI
jgi:diaminopimelate epimerase